MNRNMELYKKRCKKCGAEILVADEREDLCRYCSDKEIKRIKKEKDI